MNMPDSRISNKDNNYFSSTTNVSTLEDLNFIRDGIMERRRRVAAGEISEDKKKKKVAAKAVMDEEEDEDD
jgi:hypothetical protein